MRALIAIALVLVLALLGTAVMPGRFLRKATVAQISSSEWSAQAGMLVILMPFLMTQISASKRRWLVCARSSFARFRYLLIDVKASAALVGYS
jgi:Na+(H+)/acetate symporter ActP